MADVADFVVGEVVLVELEPVADSFRVKRISPDIPRFRTSAIGPMLTDVSGDLRELSMRLLSALPGRDVDRLYDFSDDGLVIEGIDDTSYADVPCYRLLLRGIEYVELPRRWETKLVRLSTNEERTYLATRFESDGKPSLCVTWIREERRFHFVACASIEELAISR